jgi:hypothetical protein
MNDVQAIERLRGMVLVVRELLRSGKSAVSMQELLSNAVAMQMGAEALQERVDLIEAKTISADGGRAAVL